MIEFEIFSEGGIGKINEDYVLHTDIPSGLSLFIVGDGMGGLAYGATASRLTAKSIAEYLKQNFTPQTPEQSIINALHYANITRCINGKKFRHPPVVCNFKIQQGMRILMATDGYYLHNDIYSTPETININDDDASSVRISFR